MKIVPGRSSSIDAYTIIGVGGIGCALAYALAVGGSLVQCVEATAAKLHWGRLHGLRVNRLPSMPAEFVAFNHWRPNSESTTILCTKCYDNERVLEKMPNDCWVLPVQNGFDSAFEGRSDLAEGIVSFVSECPLDRTHTRITRPGKLYLGMHRDDQEFATDPSKRATLEKLGASLRKGGIFSVELTDNILPYKYTKLMYNAAIGPVASAAGLDNGQLLSRPLARSLLFALIAENYHILRNAGKRLEKIGPFHPDTVRKLLDRPILAKGLSWVFYPSLRGTYCSMHADLPLGRSEIDYYNGYLIKLADGTPCPFNRRAYEVVKEMESGGMKPGLRALRQLWPGESLRAPRFARL
jgi:2-dehydropantoate 2-reductase